MRYKFRGKMHQVIVGDKASLQMPLKAHIYNKKYGNEEARRKRTSDQHNKQRRGKMSTINTEKATPQVKSLSKEQTAMKNRRVVMISLLGVAASIAGLLSFSFSLAQGSRIAEERTYVHGVVHCARGTNMFVLHEFPRVSMRLMIKSPCIFFSSS